ncbi:MAG TPA: hypothetical protein VHK89_10030 [Actinomycetota bacterium]|nr:hypothetical protein [Actinomycetota bacterium]
MLEEGWYLMSAAEVEAELARLRDPSRPATGARRLSSQDALARRDAGNVPDGEGRSLRLVLHNDRPGVPGAVEARRLRFEPDYHDAPRWRRHGSVPVTVVPLAVGPRRSSPAPESWLDDPALAALESEWRATGAVAGLAVPPDLRGFVFKTVLALRAGGVEVSPATVSDSIARWVPPHVAEEIRAALTRANAS